MYYHLGAYEDSLTYALGAGDLFDVNGHSEYVETIIGNLFIYTVVLVLNKFFETDLIIKVNVKNERRFDRPTVIFKFKVRSKN